jgi:hypothetical protein
MEVLRIVLNCLSETVYQGLTERDKLARRRFSLPDRQTPLHYACQPEHFDEALVKALVDCEPECVAMKCKQGITPLHLLCDQAIERRRRAPTIPIDVSVRLIKRMLAAMPKAARIRDKLGRLHLHAYVENEYLVPKDPMTVAALLHQPLPRK